MSVVEDESTRRTAFRLALLLGVVGGHRFYLGRWGAGLRLAALFLGGVTLSGIAFTTRMWDAPLPAWVSVVGYLGLGLLGFWSLAWIRDLAGLRKAVVDRASAPD